MTSELAWRLATPADVPVVNALAVRSIRTLHAGSYVDDVIEEAVRYAYGVDWQLIRDSTYFVAQIGGVVVGAGGWSYRDTIAGAHGSDDPAGSRLDPMHDAARIRAFYVDPEHTRLGIGALLLNLSEKAAQEAGFAETELTSTIPAVSFYAKFGYRRIRSFEMPLPSKSILKLELMKKRL